MFTGKEIIVFEKCKNLSKQDNTLFVHSKTIIKCAFENLLTTNVTKAR